MRPQFNKIDLNLINLDRNNRENCIKFENY